MKLSGNGGRKWKIAKETERTKTGVTNCANFVMQSRGCFLHGVIMQKPTDVLTEELQSGNKNRSIKTPRVRSNVSYYKRIWSDVRVDRRPGYEICCRFDGVI
jgi:hypothetical protein